MKIKQILIVFMITTVSLAMAHAQDIREGAVAGMHKVDPSQMGATYRGSAPLAQKLVDEALAKHPQIVLIAIHAGAPKYWTIASNFGRLGRIADEDDMRCVHTGKNNLEADKSGTHFEVELPLKDKSGNIIEALGTVFNYKTGDHKKAMEAIGVQAAIDMAQQISWAKILFDPAKEPSCLTLSALTVDGNSATDRPTLSQGVL